MPAVLEGTKKKNWQPAVSPAQPAAGHGAVPRSQAKKTDAWGKYVGAVWQEKKGKVVLASVASTAASYTPEGYAAWRKEHAEATVCTEASAPTWLRPSMVFEKRLPAQYTVHHMDKRDLLRHWHWTTYRTGITSAHERAHSLAMFACYKRTGNKHPHLRD